MVQEGKIRIRRANIYDWDEAMALAWRTFLRFEANDYGQEGIDNFRDFLTDALLHRMFLKGDYPVFIALDGEKQAGMISLRNKRHISLLFVEEGHHHQGIGRKLIQSMEQYIQAEYQERKITVNAAPYAVGFTVRSVLRTWRLSCRRMVSSTRRWRKGFYDIVKTV